MIARRLASFSFCMVVLCGSGAVAQDVTLIARGGDLTVRGTLLGYDGAYYRIGSEFGELTIEGTGVTCEGTACPDTENFIARATFSGAEAVGNRLVPPLIEAYARGSGYDLQRREIDERSFSYTLRPVSDDRAPIELTFRLGTSGEGFADLIADEADLAMSVREITGTEAALAQEAGRGDLRDPRRSRILALDALVPVVSAENPREAISFEDLRRVAAGEESGTALYLPSVGSGLEQAFRQIVLGHTRLASGVVRRADAQTLEGSLSGDGDALGVTAFSDIGGLRPVSILGACGSMIGATVESIKAEDYPLTTPVFLYAPARRLPDPVRDFIEYTMSPSAQEVVRRTGFVDQFPVRIPFAAQGVRLLNALVQASDEITLSDLREMAVALNDMARLSISFRFEGGSAELDAQSRSNILLLSRAIEEGTFDGHAMSFVGFSDGLGPSSTNRRLSLRRARAVREAIETELGGNVPGDIRLRTEGFGEAFPMACNDTEWGGQVNRRVEVWLD